MRPEADDPKAPATDAGTSIVRRFVDNQQRHWTAQEVASPHYDRRGTRDLIFASAEIVRRVRNYPTNWHTLPDHELYALSFRP